MPWTVEQGGGTCAAAQWAVVKDDDGSTAGCHDTKAAAEEQQAALYASEGNGRMVDAPREDLIRMSTELRHDEDGNTLVGYAAVFDDWTEIDSWEGRFRERLTRGAFRKTLRDNGVGVKVLFNHGMDPSIGDKPLGRAKILREDERGLYVEVPLDDTSYNRDIKALLKSGALDGMSFRMTVTRDDWDKLDSDLPERTIKEVRLYEFGPVTFPAYAATEAGVRAHAPRAFEAWRTATRRQDENKVSEPDIDGSEDAPPDAGHPSENEDGDAPDETSTRHRTDAPADPGHPSHPGDRVHIAPDRLRRGVEYAREVARFRNERAAAYSRLVRQVETDTAREV